MLVKLVAVKNTRTSKDIPEGTIFYADSVGTSDEGVYLKDNGWIWPILDGRKADRGKAFASVDCPVFGYDPIQFTWTSK